MCVERVLGLGVTVPWWPIVWKNNHRILKPEYD